MQFDRLASVRLLAGFVGATALASALAFALGSSEVPPRSVRTAVDDAGIEFRLPDNWPPAAPLPVVKNNCVRCHADKGGALTDAVLHYAHGTHDLEEIGCQDCHGGNTEDDERAHEGDFVSGKLSVLMERCSDCHVRDARSFKASAHYSPTVRWDYPICSSCHDNHATGKGGFRLARACDSCHGTKASAATGSGESGIEWTSRTEGSFGNRISVELKAEGAGRDLDVSWTRASDPDSIEITVCLATDGGGRSVSTAAEVLDAVRAERELYSLLDARDAGDSLGEGVVEPAPRIGLTGGTGFEAEFPAYAEAVRAQDELWDALGALRRLPRAATPRETNEEIARARNQAMRIFHASPAEADVEETRIYADRARALAGRIREILERGQAPPETR